jgi:hypothetical protein
MHRVCFRRRDAISRVSCLENAMRDAMRRVSTGIFVVALFFTACATREEGCNDAFANNFSLGADKACKSCCTYPVVRIRLTHKYGSTAMVYKQPIFKDGAGNSLSFEDLRFYLSNVQLLSNQNKVIEVQEPLDIYLERAAGDTIRNTVASSYGQARGVGQTDIGISSFRDTATINRLRFTIGVLGEMNQANPLRLPSTHPLRSSISEGMFLGAQNGYVFIRALFTGNQSTDLKISSAANLRTIQVNLPANLVVKRGYNVNILMDINYAVWFQNVNVNQDTPAQISQKILNQLAPSFTVTGVSTGL